MPESKAGYPKEFTARLLQWFDSAKRDLPWRNSPDAYHVWVSEIMLQQTRVETVKDYYARFLTVFPTVADLASADEEVLLKLWQGLGYYSRVRNMAKAAKIVMSEYGGSFPADVASLRRLPGIGDYTAGAVASIAFQIAAPAVDGNVVRITSRILGAGADTPEHRAETAKQLLDLYPGDNRNGDFTQGLMELGAVVCLPNGAPLCEKCPFYDDCRARLENKIAMLPEKQKKAGRKVVDMTVFLLCGPKGERAVCKRPATGLLANLWEFPHIDKTCTKTEVADFLEKSGIAYNSIRKGSAAKHIFTHIEWRMQTWLVQCKSTDGTPFVFAREEELDSAYPMPTAFRKLIL